MIIDILEKACIYGAVVVDKFSSSMTFLIPIAFIIVFMYRSYFPTIVFVTTIFPNTVFVAIIFPNTVFLTFAVFIPLITIGTQI